MNGEKQKTAVLMTACCLVPKDRDGESEECANGRQEKRETKKAKKKYRPNDV